MRYEPVQIYETTVQDNDSHTGVFFCTVPARSLPESTVVPEGSQGQATLSPKDFLISELNLRDMFPIRKDQLPKAMLALLSEEPELYRPILDTSWAAAKHHYLHTIIEGDYEKLHPEKTEFALYLIQAEIVPFENSPLEGVSLEKLLTNVSAVGLGGYIGFVVAGSSPLLFITVPAGMIICGAASGLARGLEDGLRRRIKNLIGYRRSSRRAAAHT
jgi:hypothetical protein